MPAAVDSTPKFCRDHRLARSPDASCVEAGVQFRAVEGAPLPFGVADIARFCEAAAPGRSSRWQSACGSGVADPRLAEGVA